MTPVKTSNDTLLREFEAGRKTALARVISLVENEARDLSSVLGSLHRRLGHAHRIGITGPPGAGKSTLAGALIRHFRGRGETVGVIAVDPTSPYTGGALLGDRIRMNELSLDPGVFIRSMATRGSIGGLALATREVADVMDAFGFDRILIETVGVGQAEFGIASAADTTVLVLVPESGDSIQAMKAGLMEAADLFVINKADRPGAERMAREVAMMLHLRLGKALPGARPQTRIEWTLPVLQTVAETGQGVLEVTESLDRHLEWLGTSGERERRRRDRWIERVRDEVEREVRRRIWVAGPGRAVLEENLQPLVTGEVTPYEVAARVLRRAGLDGAHPGVG